MGCALRRVQFNKVVARIWIGSARASPSVASLADDPVFISKSIFNVLASLNEPLTA